MNKKGSILILSFWALIILAAMGLGITRRVSAELSAVRYQMGRTRSKYAAFAGLFYALDLIQQDLNNKDTRVIDRAFDCGIVLAGEHTPQSLLSDKIVGEATFQIHTPTEPRRFAFEDETGKININALTEKHSRILKELLLIMDIDEETAETIAASVIDWKDDNDTVYEEEFGAEQEYYARQNPPYYCKNSYFESLEELLLVRGMTPEIFEKIRDYLTIFPEQGDLQINFNTAPFEVLLAVARSSVGAATHVNALDARSFVDQLMEFRSGSDGEWLTDDDEPVVFGNMSLNGTDLVVASTLASIQSSRALFIRAFIEGEDRRTHIKTFLDAVIQTDGLRVVSLNIQ